MLPQIISLSNEEKRKIYCYTEIGSQVAHILYIVYYKQGSNNFSYTKKAKHKTKYIKNIYSYFHLLFCFKIKSPAFLYLSLSLLKLYFQLGFTS